MKVDIAILCAMPVELIPLKNHLDEKIISHSIKNTSIIVHTGTYQNLSIAIAACGIGLTPACICTTALIENFRPTILLFSGVAGDPNQVKNIGDLIIATHCFEDNALTHQQLVEGGWCDSLNIIKHSNDTLIEACREISMDNNILCHYGTVMSSNAFPAPTNYKTIVKEHKVEAVDMETAAFYEACDNYNIPHLCIRSFCNGISNSEKESIEENAVSIAAKNAANFCFKLINIIAARTEFFIPEHSYSEAETLIKQLNLQSHPEGGFYHSTHRSNHTVRVPMDRYNAATRNAGTSIYYLLKSTDISHWHRIKSDETWYFHKGSSLTLHMLDESTGEYTYIILGDPLIENEAKLQYTIPADIWFSASVNTANSYTLVGCAVHPGFEFCDFELGTKEYLLEKFSSYSEVVIKYAIKNKEEVVSEQ